MERGGLWAAGAVRASLLLGVLLCGSVFGQGNLTAYSVSGNKVTFTCSGATVYMTVLLPGLIRVTSPAQNSSRYHKADWAPVSFTHEDKGAAVEIKTSELIIQITKTPFLISISNTAGELLCKDDPSGGMQLGSNSCTLKKTIQEGEHFFGFGQTCRAMKESKYSCDITGTNSKGADWGEAQSSTFFYSTKGYGIYLNMNGTAGHANCEFHMGDVSPTYYTLAEKTSKNLDYFFMNGPDFSSIVDHYTELTGRPRLLRKWIHGYIARMGAMFSVRYAEVEGVVNFYRTNHLPVDGAFLDGGWCGSGGMARCPCKNADGYMWFCPDQFNGVNKSGDELLKWFDQKGIKFIPNTGAAYLQDYAKAPGEGVAINKQHWQYYVDHGFDMVWHDFPAWQEYTGQKNESDNATAAHKGDSSYPVAILMWQCAPGAQSQGLLVTPGCDHGNEQRFAVVADLSGTLAGLPYHHTDGISGDPRWAVIAMAMQPVVRAHLGCQIYWERASDDGSKPAGFKDHFRKWMGFHYRLIPYIFSYAGVANQTGVPIMRHMVWHNRTAADAYKQDYQFYLGDWLVAAPYVEQRKPIEFGAERRPVWLPPGTWYDWFEGTEVTGPKTIQADVKGYKLPLYVKAGAIIPMMPFMEWVGQVPEDPLTLAVWPQGNTSFVLYEDETRIKTTLRCDQSPTQTTVSIPAFAGSAYSPQTRKYELEVHRINPKAVFRDAAPLAQKISKADLDAASEGWFYDPAVGGICYVKPNGNAAQGFSVSLSADGSLSGVTPHPSTEQMDGLVRSQSAGVLSVTLPWRNQYEVEVFTLAGQRVLRRTGCGPERCHIPIAPRGDRNLLVRVSVDGHGILSRFVTIR